jgi:hypothetical protein
MVSWDGGLAPNQLVSEKNMGLLSAKEDADLKLRVKRRCTHILIKSWFMRILAIVGAPFLF